MAFRCATDAKGGGASRWWSRSTGRRVDEKTRRWEALSNAKDKECRACGAQDHMRQAAQFLRAGLSLSAPGRWIGKVEKLAGQASSLGGENLDGVQPRLDGLRPSGDGKRGAAQAEAVTALRVNVQLSGDFGVFQKLVVDEDVFDVNGIVFSLHQERGRRLVRRLDFRIGRKILFGECEIARIHNDREVRAAGELVGIVDGIVEACVEMRAERGGKMRAGRES